jgi:ABC-type amino acid transport substrate-binding protein
MPRTVFHNTMNRLLSSLLLPLLLFVLAGCTNLASNTLVALGAGPDVLQVGMAVDSPPLVYKKNGVITGLETKFAVGLSRFIGKKLQLIELDRQALAQALLEKKIDIIMSGLPAAGAREQQLAISAPYLLSGQSALVHLDDYKRLAQGSRNLTGQTVRLGVVAGSPGDTFINSLQPKGKTTRFTAAPEGVGALLDDRIDVFIHDLPANFYYASLYIDKGLTPGVTRLTHEELVWAVRPDDTELLQAANDYLRGIRKSGELDLLIERSLPFYKNTAYSPKN